MSEHKQPNYMGVFWTLLVLTIAEVAIVMIRIPKAMMIVSLVALAIAKAALVAAYFMHLKFEKKALWVIASAPLILGGILIFNLIPDARHAHRQAPREARPAAPAHGGAHPDPSMQPSPGTGSKSH